MSEIMSIEKRNNATMIAQMAELGILKEDVATLDCTFGLGRFWKKWKPALLIGTDLDPARSYFGLSVDYTNMEIFPDEFFGQIIFDPPYKLNGKSTGKGVSASDADYGVSGAYVNAKDRHDNIFAGVAECYRVLAPGGVLVLKCQNQICNGKMHWQVFEFTAYALSLGLELEAQFMNESWRPQPPGREQKSARNNYSTALVLRKPKK